MATTERRYRVTELRAKSGTVPRITGHAAVFNQLSDDLGGFREKIRPGAFAETIKESDVRALWNHDPNFVLARTKNKTLVLEEDNIGLAFDAALPETQQARDFFVQIERGDVDQMSFGFMVLPDGDTLRWEDGGVVRELIKVELFDVSPVTFPAYPQTDVSVRSRAGEMRKKICPDQEAARAALAARLEQRKAFIAARIPAPDPLSFAEIVKKARLSAKSKV